jgi:hypothetical protein
LEEPREKAQDSLEIPQMVGDLIKSEESEESALEG